MNRDIRRAAAALGAAALLLPSAAIATDKPAKPDKAAKPAKPAKPATPAHGKAKPANYVFKGVWHGDGTVTVNGGNARVRRGGLVGQTLAFDLAAAKLGAADTDADGSVTVADLVEGDKVVVKARLPRTDPGQGPYAARKLVDQTHPAVEAPDKAPEAPEPTEAAQD